MEQWSESKETNQGLFQCNQCKKTYTRVDHLARHVRSHLQERPFQCETCNRAFGRPYVMPPDLLKRHAACHDPENASAKKQKRQMNASSRVFQACKACASAKLKCDDTKPCKRCKQKGISCQYAGATQEPAPSSQQQQHSRSSTASMNPSQRPDAPRREHSAPSLGDQGQMQEMCTPGASTHGDEFQVHGHQQETSQQAPMMLQDHYYSDFLRGVITPATGEAYGSYAAQDWTTNAEMAPRNILDFSTEGNLELDSTDFGLLDHLMRQPGPVEAHHFEGFGPSQYDYSRQASGGFNPRKHVGIGIEAFRKSSMTRWLPEQQDRAHAELRGLSIPKSGLGSPSSRLNLDGRRFAEDIELSSRDRVLALILRTCDKTLVSKIVAAFPTTPLLDDFLDCFFRHQCTQPVSWFHIPTFAPNDAKTELLGAALAMGATLSGVKALQKLGFAIQEAVRLTIPSTCEEQNSVTRELWLVQSFILELEVGMWSGYKRKMELAESHEQIIVTMLRRGAKFQRARHVPPPPRPDDSGEKLQLKWRQWSEYESFKRLVFQLFLHDAQASMTMLMNPLISYAELSLDLPSSRELWLAEDAEQWKTIYLSLAEQSPMQRLSLKSCLQNPALLATLPTHHDPHFSGVILLHGFWGMIWDYAQHSSMFHGNGNIDAYNTVRHQHICQLLQRARMGMADWNIAPTPEVPLLFDLLLMHLHVSLDDVQLFAGKEDQEEARRVLPGLQQWIMTTNSRQAIWHAGQVLRAAKSFRPRHLRDFYAVAVYHAALVFWTFGVISQSKSPRGDDSSLLPLTGAGAPNIFLDGIETPELQRFIGLGRGNPLISCSPTPGGDPGEVVCLTDPEASMNVMLSTLRKNFWDQADVEVAPPLVENLMQLLRDIGKAASSVGQ